MKRSWQGATAVLISNVIFGFGFLGRRANPELQSGRDLSTQVPAFVYPFGGALVIDFIHSIQPQDASS